MLKLYQPTNLCPNLHFWGPGCSQAAPKLLLTSQILTFPSYWMTNFKDLAWAFTEKKILRFPFAKLSDCLYLPAFVGLFPLWSLPTFEKKWIKIREKHCFRSLFFFNPELFGYSYNFSPYFFASLLERKPHHQKHK